MSTPIESPQETEIGKFYRVPCARISAHRSWANIGEYVPVYGPLHEDKKYFGLDAVHLHLDFRFFTARQWRIINDCSNIPSGLILEPRFYSEIVLRRRKCGREMPTFPVIEPRMGGSVRRMEQDFADKKLCLKTLICPHRGICLKGMPMVDGTVVCPGHGLKWSVETGELIRRYPEIKGGNE